MAEPTPTTLYRIVDMSECGQILANRIPDPQTAQTILELVQLEYPAADLVIESYRG